MKTIELLEHLVEDYKQAVSIASKPELKEILKTLDGRWRYFEDSYMMLGVCNHIDTVYSQYHINKASYWILRHISHQGAYWCPTLYTDQYSDAAKILQTRLNILEAELAHHKKWG